MDGLRMEQKDVATRISGLALAIGETSKELVELQARIRPKTEVPA
ncbi:MAG: hypothetical protein ACYDDZ_06580 [Acidimicrobiales bacterium]